MEIFNGQCSERPVGGALNPEWPGVTSRNYVTPPKKKITVGRLKSCGSFKVTCLRTPSNKRFNHLLNVQINTGEKAYEDTEGPSLRGCKQGSALKQTLFMLTRGWMAAVAHSSVRPL